MLKEYRSVSEIVGPLMLIENVEGITYYELAEIEMKDGTIRQGRVLEVDGDKALVQVFEGTSGLNVNESKVLSVRIELPVSMDMLGPYSMDGSPRDNGPRIIPEDRRDIEAAPNPTLRLPRICSNRHFPIDGLNTLVRGQKLPFSRLPVCPIIT